MKLLKILYQRSLLNLYKNLWKKSGDVFAYSNMVDFHVIKGQNLKELNSIRNWKPFSRLAEYRSTIFKLIIIYKWLSFQVLQNFNNQGWAVSKKLKETRLWL